MSNEKISGNNVSESLKIILVKKNMNIAKLAELMGLSSTTLYSKFKRGNFSVKDLNEISKALNLSYEITFTIND
jgi:DNA-binding phage protein